MSAAEMQIAVSLYGCLRISWPPIRRQRIRGSPSTLTQSNVARPSGPENDQVIS
jgi:hypothetical protein